METPPALRLIFAGTPRAAVPSLEALLASSHEVIAVVTRPDAPAGRGRHVTKSAVRAIAEAHHVPVLTPAKVGDPTFLAQLRELAPDCCPVVAYGALLPQATLDIPRFGWINLHFSLLPAWRGAAPVPAAIWHGDEMTGASVLQIEQALDSGPIFGAVTEKIHPTDTAGDVLTRLAHSGAELLVSCIDAISAGRTHAVPQPAEGVSYAPKITVDDARVDWTLPAFAVDRRIRACTPAPGAWTNWRGSRLKLGPVSVITDSPIQPLAASTGLNPGEVRLVAHEVLVGTATSPVQLHEVKPEGKRTMPAIDWAHGARLAAGEKFDAHG